MSKRSKSQKQQPLSPKKYILTRARMLPLYKCFITNNWEAVRMASIVVSRKHNNGNVTAGFYLVDLLARGVKDTHFVFNAKENEIFYGLDKSAFEETGYELAHNIIYGAIAFAEQHGFRQHKDLVVTEYILEEDTEDIEFIEVDFGIDGKPAFVDQMTVDDDAEIVHNFRDFTDDEWRDYLLTPDPPGFGAATDALFEKWYRENGGVIEGLPDTSNVTYDPIHPPYKNHDEERVATEIYHNLTDSSPKQKHEIKAIEKKLHELIRANPDNPTYYNFLATCADIKNDDALARTITKQTLEKFPDYLFAKTNYALICLKDNRYAEAAEVMGASDSLTGMFLNRDVFHASEVVSFHNCKLALAIADGDLIKAMFHYTILCQLHSEYLDPSDLFQLNESQFAMKKLMIVGQYIRDKGYITDEV